VSAYSADVAARRVIILGATGSIGTQALDVLQREADAFELVGLSADRSWETLVDLALEHGVRRIALSDAQAAERASLAWDGEVLSGADGLIRLVAESGADLVLNALVGAAGLAPTVATLAAGIDLALANKESLVAGGELVMALAEGTGARLLPVDSEHAALHHLLAAVPPGACRSVTLTASGGPFRGADAEELEQVTVERALAHPTWSMGGKISIDSATLMNKGLEVIEAHHLFALPYDRIGVVVHPQSIVHALVETADGAQLAHLGLPDMRIAIAYALCHPEIAELPTRRLDLTAIGSLQFEPVDDETFPCLRLCRQAAAAGGTAPAILNAANEVAVHAFLDGRLPFTAIAAVIDRTLDNVAAEPVDSFETLYAADEAARTAAAAQIEVRA